MMKMIKENGSFLDRVDSISRSFDKGYISREQKENSEIQRDLDEIGVRGAFEEIINGGIIRVGEDSNSPVHIEYGSIGLCKGYFLVFNDIYNRKKDDEGWETLRVEKDAISVAVYPEQYCSEKEYLVGCFHIYVNTTPSTGNDFSSQWRPSNKEYFDYRHIGQKKVKRSDVMDNLATIVAIFKHNQKGISDFITYP